MVFFGWRLGGGGRWFILHYTQHQIARLENKTEPERLILGDIPELRVQILELCREHRRVTVVEATRVTGASRNAIKDHLKALAKAFHIELHVPGEVRGMVLADDLQFD